jgi:hypothetical protein
MGLTAVTSGTQAATLSTEHSLTQQTGIGIYVLEVDASAMEAGDTLVLRLKTKVLSGGASKITQEATLSGAQAVPHWRSEAIPVDVEIIATLLQSVGTGRSYPWKLLRA